jgi:prolyl 4-hydroxylase
MAMPSDAEWKPYYEPPNAPFSEQRSPVRAQLGASVGDKLNSTSGVWRLCPGAGRAVQFYLRDNFLSAEECRGLVEQIDAGCYPSTLFEQEKYAGIRTSQSCNLNVYDPLVAEVDSRIADLLGINRALGEPLQGQRYEVTQCFQDHVDFFYVDQPYWEEYASHGGQRTWTAMIYLSQVARGGGTRFSLLDVEIEPKIGRILVWNNMAEDGSPNGWVLHSGQPVDDGVKYIVTKWYRERPFV